ncbi:hypothetical protein Back11_12970 [Paenibacillus baekrokdamisoli]|uniref:Uncharacterized protein n=1 Tax=Paenibacillus baekrokdamisoli TaxID=1712516 RepID=A0A3G9INY1_9BACL|nr:hypothetical protein Back11_12970 [Paenibacillus baekrokdamisoli]
MEEQTGIKADTVENIPESADDSFINYGCVSLRCIVCRYVRLIRVRCRCIVALRTARKNDRNRKDE